MAWTWALLLGSKEGRSGACALRSSVYPESFYGQLCSTQRKEVYTWERDPRCFQESRQDGVVGEGAGRVSGTLLLVLVPGGRC